jgi:polysaccharide chain length determinant protein (PEP-CTERM system associated)
MIPVTEAKRYTKAGWHHRWKALAIAWLICLPGWAGVQMLPSQYQSSARLLADADAVLGALLRGIAIDSVPTAQVDILQRTLLSRPNLERVIARTDLDMRVDSIEARERILQDLARKIRITVQARSLFTINYTDADPQVARGVVQALLDLFIEKATATDRQQMESAQTFVSQQIAEYETQLRQAEQRRAEFRSRYLDLLPDGPTGVTGLEQARSRLQRLRGELEDARQRHNLMRQQLEATPATLSAAEAGGDGRLADAERTLRELRLRFTDQHPAVIEQRNIVAELRTSTGRATPRTGSIPNPLYEQLRLRAVEAEMQFGSLERQIRDEQATIERLEALARGAPQLQAEFINLDRDYNVVRQNYEELLARREALQIAGAARTGADRVRLEVVDPPLAPTSPSGPNRLLLSLGVLAVGLGAGLGLAVLLVVADRSFYTVQDLRKIGLPVLGAVSLVRPPTRHTFGTVTFVGCLGLLLAAFGAIVAAGPALVAHLPPLLARFTA